LIADAVEPTCDLKLFNVDALAFNMGVHVEKESIKNKYFKKWDDTSQDDKDNLPNVRLIGNLPFNIATPLLFKLLESISMRSGLFSIGRVPMAFLFQEEFAIRLISPEGYNDRSRASIMSQSFCNVKVNFRIPSK
jgi:16S rRNA A1518/A1519 N6-dimethyltransferase RsmA/KsgA/DIM1 with predicted DNA glycosylase/AP lyase activity